VKFSLLAPRSTDIEPAKADPVDGTAKKAASAATATNELIFMSFPPLRTMPAPDDLLWLFFKFTLKLISKREDFPAHVL
jgi:hypothetical protein